MPIFCLGQEGRLQHFQRTVPRHMLCACCQLSFERYILLSVANDCCVVQLLRPRPLPFLKIAPHLPHRLQVLLLLLQQLLVQHSLPTTCARYGLLVAVTVLFVVDCGFPAMLIVSGTGKMLCKAGVWP